MANLLEQGGKKMTIGNDKGNHKNKVEEIENRRLQKILQKVINTEKAPDSLRVKISKMIRER